jgi:8-oxo-dGTP pyrophosphatase MutT (NUDIX family)
MGYTVLDNIKRIVMNELGEIIRIRSSGIICKKIIDDKIYFLVVKQIGGKWSFPKGGHEENEDKFQCALREFKEEVGIDISSDIIRENQVKTISIFCNTYYIINNMYKVLSPDNIQKLNEININSIKNNDINLLENEKEILDISWIDYHTILDNISCFNADVRMVIHPKKLYSFHDKIFGKNNKHLIQTQYQYKTELKERCLSPIHFLSI